MEDIKENNMNIISMLRYISYRKNIINEFIQKTKNLIINKQEYQVLSLNEPWGVLLGSSLALSLEIDYSSCILSNESEMQFDLDITSYNRVLENIIFCCGSITNENIFIILKVINILKSKFQMKDCILFTHLIEDSIICHVSSLVLIHTSQDLIQQFINDNQISTILSNISISQLESNLPGEDRYSYRILTEDIKCFCVIDGHGGYLAADLTLQYLLDMIINEITKSGLISCKSTKVYEIITKCFIEMDELIMNRVKQALDIVQREQSDMYGYSDTLTSRKKLFQLAGCCVIVTIILGDQLYVAHTG